MHQPKNKKKTLPLMNKIKDKINQEFKINHSIFALHQTLSKIKHMRMSILKKLRKLKLKKVFEALEDSDWVEAMHEELNNFKRNKVWTLVEKPKECRNVIGTKWIFKNKQDEFGNILMTDRFEMSMMGEMKFFLGFEIKQLREGTFIHQAKYLQDMLKRFKMTELKGVATPMVTKCHLALDPNGGASRGGRRRSRHDRSSDEFASNAPRKSVTSRRKNKEVRENYKAMDPVSYSAIRMKNWYEDVPRDEEIEGRRYWCIEQEFIYKDVYEPMKNRDPCKLSMWTFWLKTITLKTQSG
ncbi:hypothetical protein QYE76_062433 [Lolium multiflorum]|uniref:Reverse transcriptase Ty1/copia-type domain-containing protein n=1 Tax=Lolium multiflorum TaxID=4521 RepID=A0AAD8W655_LOLMU|nr:hypothetical protein QYE76_062433 [Lolium multiflorum]